MNRVQFGSVYLVQGQAALHLQSAIQGERNQDNLQAQARRKREKLNTLGITYTNTELQNPNQTTPNTLPEYLLFINDGQEASADIFKREVQKLINDSSFRERRGQLIKGYLDKKPPRISVQQLYTRFLKPLNA